MPWARLGLGLSSRGRRVPQAPFHPELAPGLSALFCLPAMFNCLLAAETRPCAKEETPKSNDHQKNAQNFQNKQQEQTTRTTTSHQPKQSHQTQIKPPNPNQANKSQTKPPRRPKLRTRPRHQCRLTRRCSNYGYISPVVKKGESI